MTDVKSVDAGSSVSLREITEETLHGILALEVAEAQRPLVAPNAVSIAQAHFNKGAWFRGIYAEETPVGFVMLYDPNLPGAGAVPGIAASDVGLWRFMLDHRYQGLGFGQQALDLIRAHVRSLPGVTRLVASYVPAPNGPEAFYLKYGFEKTGRMVAKGTEVEIWIAP